MGFPENLGILRILWGPNAHITSGNNNNLSENECILDITLLLFNNFLVLVRYGSGLSVNQKLSNLIVSQIQQRGFFN